MKKVIPLLLLLTTPAQAQGLSPYGMWGDRDRGEFFGQPPHLEEPYEVPPWATEEYFFPLPPPPPGRSPYDFSGNVRPNIYPVEPQLVQYLHEEEIGTIIIDSGKRKLYLIVGRQEAYMYPISVGREGFAWTGVERVSRIQDWPDWTPPKEMLARRPDLPAFMPGGLKNPLGATAIYLGNTLYRIHGTNDPKSIGKAESSGCIRMMNEHVVHLAQFVQVGTIVKVY